MNVYKLTIEETIEYEFTTKCVHFYLTKDAMKNARDTYRLDNTKDGKWIPNISSIDFTEEEISFDDAKCDMTIDQFEDLFDTYVADPRL